jgi:predicted ATPase
MVPQAIASRLGVKEENRISVLEALSKRVRDRQLLLILDNCEHLLRRAPNVRRAAAGGPQVKILATSREPLHVAGEATYPLPALAVPDPQQKVAPSALGTISRRYPCSSIARAPRTELSPDRPERAFVVDICHRLDGIPLAIELAAARVRALSVQSIAERLSDRFRLLTGGDRTALPRQQTLRALIDWSYDLLTPHESALFRRIAVFRGKLHPRGRRSSGAGWRDRGG